VSAFFPRAFCVVILLAADGFSLVASSDAAAADRGDATASASADGDADAIRVAMLTYGDGVTARCFSNAFLADADAVTAARVAPDFSAVRLGAGDLYHHGVAILSGEGDFAFTDAERRNLADYLACGGFVIASAGCSNAAWNHAFAAELETIFPDATLVTLDAGHEVFHRVYDVEYSRYRSGAARLPTLHGLDIDGRLALVWSPDGLNDTAAIGGDCCCCGGDEAQAARRLNVNLLLYALTR